jgi:Zn-dependent protease
MTTAPQGSFRLFRFAGIDIYLHWLWFLVAYLQIVERPHAYSSLGWNVAEYLGLFGIVLLHEFGHSFATRQVGGTADTILLWPLGGVAYVRPPQRPGAELWSIAAGPLVNVVFFVILTVVQRLPFFAAQPIDVQLLVRNVWAINLGLLLFNLLPVYPLDGGQILRSLLWFVFGPIRSLLYATTFGLIGIVALVGCFIYWRSLSLDQSTILTVIIAVYLFSNCWAAFKQARALTQAGG